jgi:transcriptional regulator with XRE-family HTH domain
VLRCIWLGKDGAVRVTTFGEWLQAEAARRGWGQSDLAVRMNLRPGTVGRWWNDVQAPDPDYCRTLADVLGIDEAYVLYRAGHLRSLPAAPDVYETKETIRFLRESIEAMEGRLALDEIEVRYRGVVPADSVRWVATEAEERTLRVSRRLVGSRAAERLFAVAISGECLAALKIHDGDVVYCERIERLPRDGEIALVRLADEVTLKVWWRVGAGVELRDGDGQVVKTLSGVDEFTVEGVAVAREGRLAP